MTVNEKNLSRKQYAAIAALLSHSSIGDAAEAARVGERTIHRWLRLDGFNQAYRQASRQLVSQAMAQVQAGMIEAVGTLRAVITDPTAPPSARVSAARTLLDMGLRSVEIQDIEERLAAIEHRTGLTENRRYS
jgi:hypothetical protein